MKKILILTLRFYKNCIGPFLPPSCIYYPSCSEYAIGSIKKYGCFKGIFLAIFRILRCNPFYNGGFDPVK